LRLPTNLTRDIKKLIDQRHKHEAAIAAINDALAQVEGALRGSSGGRISAGPGRPRGRRRTRRTFPVSGENMILAYVKSNSNPMGREIENQWKREGRAGAAANLISKLVKAKRLKRVPLKDQRGSRYVLA
jgi:hypothetical protein